MSIGCYYFWRLAGEFISLPFPATKGHLYFLAWGPFLYLQSSSIHSLLPMSHGLLPDSVPPMLFLHSSSYNVTTWIHPDNPWQSQNLSLLLQNLFCFIRQYLWIPGIRLWTYLGGHYSAYHKYFEPREFMKYIQG